MLRIHSIYGNEKGAVLVVALAFMVVLGLLGTTAVLITTTDMKIGGNLKVSQQAFYEADAGVEEARARMRGGADPSISIDDNFPTNTQWKAYIGESVKAQGKGYDPGNTMHGRYPILSALSADFDYVVEIVHKTDGGANILFWGDTDSDGVPERNITNTGERIYLVSCWASEGGERGSKDEVQIEMANLPPVVVPGALYVEAPATIQGTSTHVIGVDGCGGPDVPGLVSTEGAGSVTETGNPRISGANSGGYDAGEPSDIVYDAPDMDVEAMFNSYARSADFFYNVTSETHTDTTTPGPGDDWGTPVLGPSLQDPSTCLDHNIVHYDTNGTYIRLSGGVTGCGILLIDGELEISGNFSWYGVVIATGSIIFTGGGNKNVTGGMLAGSEMDADLVGGNANIVYCSSAINSLLQNRPFRVLSWCEKM